MPKRWLSVRKLNPVHPDSDPQPAAKPQEFDFAFGDQPSIPQVSLPRLGPRLVQIRPTTSGSATGKRKVHTDFPSIRPRTTETQKPAPLSNLNAISKSEDSFIGLAFGSPGHPPAQFTALPHKFDENDLSPSSRRHYRAQEKASQMQSKRWRKIGTLFKSRNAFKKEDPPSGPTIGLPTGLVVLDKEPAIELGNVEQGKLWMAQPKQPDQPALNPPPPPLPEKDGLGLQGMNFPMPVLGDDAISRPSTADATAGSSSVVTALRTRPQVPKLELAIPRNLDAAKRSSSLLARRSKTLESLKSFDDSRPTTKYTSSDSDGNSKPGSATITTLIPLRRLTTPTMTRSPMANKYSLFPTTSPAPIRFVGRVPTPDPGTLSTLQLKRSMTSPARLSPMQDRFSISPTPEPLHPKRMDMNDSAVYSPEDNTASTSKSAPWSTHSIQSSVSSATTTDEIFFDIKSFRDSKGVEDGQFVMTRPDSVQVELARTRSKRAPPGSRLRQVEASTTDEPPVRSSSLAQNRPGASTSYPSTYTTKHSSVNTAYFDEAIAAVERLTTPTGGVPHLDKIPSIQTVTIAHHEDKSLLPLAKAQPSKPSDHYLRLGGKSHEQVSRLIPSPVVEMKEDESPRPDAPFVKALTPRTIEQIQVAKVVSPRMAVLKRIDRPIDDSPTIPQGPPIQRTATPLSPLNATPPPVPMKDAKFIPMSKFAPKGTVTAIEQRAGVTPTRIVRANTEDLSQRSSPARGTKDRSSTMPSFPEPPSHLSPQSLSLRGLEKVVPPPRPNPVGLNPTSSTEVAVARTISLSRKQSARVHVPGPRLAARRAQSQGRNQSSSPAKRQPPAHNRNTSTASQKSNKSGRSFLGHRHKRTTSSAKSISNASKEFSKAKVTKTTAEGKSSGGVGFGQSMWSKESEKQMIKEARKWEILEKKSYSPIVVQPERGHRPGLSVTGLLVESA